MGKSKTKLKRSGRKLGLEEVATWNQIIQERITAQCMMDAKE
jgi:hypothetical protein